MIRRCPKLEIKKVHPDGSYETELMPCIKEECIAYSWGCCMYYGHERVETEEKEVQE